MPFTREQFLSIFATFNQHLWPVVLLLWIASAIFTFRPRVGALYARVLLASAWLTSAVYHAAFFTRINPAAWVFAAAFVTQAAYVLSPFGRRVLVLPKSWREHKVALMIALCALAYPFLTVAAGERYPAMPAFGVPCPTTLLTIGILLAIDGPVPIRLAAIPLAWCVVGGSGAFLLGMRVDLTLVGAAAFLIWHIRPVRRQTFQRAA